MQRELKNYEKFKIYEIIYNVQGKFDIINF